MCCKSTTPPATAGTCAGKHVSRSRCAERTPAGYGGDVSGQALMCPGRSLCTEHHPAGYGGGACVPLAMHSLGAHPRRLRRGRERARMCPAKRTLAGRRTPSHCRALPVSPSHSVAGWAAAYY